VINPSGKLISGVFDVSKEFTFSVRRRWFA
jgi:hypothetical protein